MTASRSVALTRACPHVQLHLLPAKYLNASQSPEHREEEFNVTRRHYEQIQEQASWGVTGNTALVQDMLVLHRLARGLRRVNRAGGIVSVETGFANGGSTVAILSGLSRGSTHLSIDPYQNAPAPHVMYNAAGLRGVQWYLAQRPASFAPTFFHVNETSSLGLATLLSRRVSVCVPLCLRNIV